MGSQRVGHNWATELTDWLTGFVGASVHVCLYKKCDVSFFFLMNVQLLQHHLWKGLYCLHWNTFEHLSKMVFLWLFVLFYWSGSMLSMKLQCLNNLVFSYALVNYGLADFLLTGVWDTERKVLELQTKIVDLFILRSLRSLSDSSRTQLKRLTHTNTSNVDFL